MSDVHLLVKDPNKDKPNRLLAQGRLIRKLVAGQTPTIDEVATARGLVIRERENSIFSDAWVPLAIIFLIVGFVANRNMPIILLGSTLLLIAAVSFWWKNNALHGVTYERHLDKTHVFPHEPIHITITIRNQKYLPLSWIQFNDRFPFSPVEEGSFAKVSSKTRQQYHLRRTFSLSGHEELTRPLTLKLFERGFYYLGPVTYTAGDIFTLFTVTKEYDYLSPIVVYPRIWPIAQLGLPAKEPFGNLKTKRSLFTDPVRTQGIRDYEPTDRFRDIHWKATARRNQLQTKIFDPSTGLTIAVFLNVATSPKHWMGHHPERLEQAVSVAGSILNYGVEQKWGAGLYANGSIPKSDQSIRVPPGRSPKQLLHLLEALAAVTEFATTSIEKLMVRESPNLPWASTMVLVTAIITEEMLVALLQLKQAGRRVALISLDPEPTPFEMPPNIIYYHIPPTIEAFQLSQNESINSDIESNQFKPGLLQMDQLS